VKQVELTEPLDAVRRAGADVALVSLEPSEVQMFNHLDKGGTIAADRAVADADPTEFDALVLPGGVANPDRLRTDANAVRFVRGFFEQDKPIAAICHGTWLVEADVVNRRTVTSDGDILAKPEDRSSECRANWVDEEVHVDNGNEP
jgi:protease I